MVNFARLTILKPKKRSVTDRQEIPCLSPRSWTEGPGLCLGSGVMIHEGCHPCEHYAIVGPSAWSWSLTQDLFRWTLVLMVKPYIRLAEIEVSLQARGCSRNCFPRKCSSLSLAYLGSLPCKHMNQDGISLSEFSINTCDPSGNTRSWNPSTLVVGRVPQGFLQ